MIYDYNECQKIFNTFSNTIIKEINPIGYTALEKLPIRCFTLGSGKNSVVVSASQHSNEVISTTFIIYLMNYLIKNNLEFEDLTIYFIPILNPEGYLINTYAIRSKIPKNESYDKLIKYCYQYYKNYKYDNINLTNFKLHQLMFNDVDYKIVNPQYNILKDSVGEILSKHPKGSIIDWASNGKGIDLNSNSVNKIVSENEFNKKRAYNNIRMDIPSPIGYPGDNSNPFFEQEIEILSLKKLMEELDKKSNLLGFLNYHSVGGIIFQRPEDNNNMFSIIYNYLLSKFYQEYTTKNNGKYEIVKDSAGKITSVNDTLRIMYPGNLLIELSPMSGNPIGVFGDPRNFIGTIDSNINSFVYTMKNINRVYKISNSVSKESSSKVEDAYKHVDEIYEDIILKK